VLWVIWGVSIMIAFFLRVFLKKGEYVRKRKIHEKKIKRLLSRPETKILLPTEKMIRWNDLEAFSRLSMLEKTMKKHYILQQRVTSAMKNLANRIESTKRQF
jgi:biopolymer transport protein ExbB/TolQ